MSCPPLTELCVDGAATALQDHLAACPRCRAIVARVGSTEPPAAVAAVTEHAGVPASPAPRPGGVWTFWAPAWDEYLVGAVLEAERTELLIVPLMLDTAWAAEDDVVLAPDVLGYPALAPVWAGDHVLAEQAAEAVGMLSERHFDQLGEAYDTFFAGEPLPEPGGPPVLGDADPRIVAHAAIADDLRPFYAPWAMLQGADELGPVAAARRDDLGIAVEELSERIDVDPRTWTAFEAGGASPDAGIPVVALGRAVHVLQLVRSERVVALAHASVYRHHLDDVRGERTQARRRRGVVPPARREEVAARAAADRYADALRKAMGL